MKFETNNSNFEVFKIDKSFKFLKVKMPNIVVYDSFILFTSIFSFKFDCDDYPKSSVLDIIKSFAVILSVSREGFIHKCSKF